MQQQSTFSFFDEENPKMPFGFVSPSPAQLETLKIPPSLSHNFTCKDLLTNLSKQGLHALHKELLTYYQSGVMDGPTSVLDITYSKMKFAPLSPTNKTPTITLTKDGYSFELVFSDNETMESWASALKHLCVMTNFHDEYKASKMIGRGSFAKVFLVEAKSTGKQFAVKAFPKESVGGEAGKLKFQRTMINEINIMREVVHDNIIKLYEVHETERSLYLVMELIEGKPLQSPLSRNQLTKDYSERAIIEMIRSILDALAYIDSKGIMHRDLKPDNILLDKTGKLKIADFGLATFVDVPEYIFKKCGTPGYIAPEVFRYEQHVPSTAYNARCDVFSAGCILYYMLFGAPLFDGTNATEVLDLNKTFKDIQTIHHIKKEIKNTTSKINKDGLNLVLQLLEIDPKQRITAAEALSHPYFLSSTISIPKFASSKEISITTKNYIDVSPSSSRTIKKSEDRLCGSLKSEMSEHGPLTASRNRFTQKESFYLDVGRPDFNGKITTLANKSGNTSVNYSLFIKADGNSSAAGSVAGQTKPTLLSHQRKRRQSRSFKAFNTPGNQSFLKAAIFNNMQRRSEVEVDDNDTEEGKVDGRGPKLERRNTDNNLPPASNGTSSPSSGSEDLDIGDEDSHVEVNLAKVKIGTSEKHSSKRMPDLRRLQYPITKKI